VRARERKREKKTSCALAGKRIVSQRESGWERERARERARERERGKRVRQ